ncbi:MAG: hypothetical protein J0H64_10615, partial [Actinobacteria bacterium]|nr:hypothetical protein [Actinomycetota bacterium]
ADAAGLISATGLPVGQYTISVSAPAGSRLKNGTTTATVTDGGHATATVELLPLTDRTIAGTVVDQHGDPVRGATATLSAVQHGTPAVLPAGSPLLGSGANPQTTGRTGAFAWTVADGDYRVSVRSTECGSAQTTVAFDPTGAATPVLTLECAEQNVTPPKPSEPPTEQLPDTGAQAMNPLLPGGSLALIVASAALLLVGGRSRMKASTTR